MPIHVIGIAVPMEINPLKGVLVFPNLRRLDGLLSRNARLLVQRENSMSGAVLADFCTTCGGWYCFRPRAVRTMSTETQRTCPSCGNELSEAM
jgi:hypothetical protein